MQKTISEIAKFLDGEILGDKGLVITGLASIKEAKQGELTFVDNPKYFPLLKTTKASAVFVSQKTDVKDKTFIVLKNPSLAFAKAALFFKKNDYKPLKGIHKTAVIAKDVKLGKNVAIGPYVVIEEKVVIAHGTRIYSGSFIGAKTTIGEQSLIYPNVTIREGTTIGKRVIIHSGTVIGSDGFGYVNVKGAHEKIPQIGTVVVEDDVEIGANVTIDRARFDKTIIGRGTKIDNLVQIAHNVTIGEGCIIVSQVGISGSVTIGKNAILAGQAGVAGHLTIGEGAVVMAQSGVTKSIAPKTTVSGFPAKEHGVAKKINAHTQRLPEYAQAIKELKNKIATLEIKLNSLSQEK